MSNNYYFNPPQNFTKFTNFSENTTEIFFHQEVPKKPSTINWRDSEKKTKEVYEELNKNPNFQEYLGLLFQPEVTPPLNEFTPLLNHVNSKQDLPANRASSQKWTSEDNALLLSLVQKQEALNWPEIASEFNNVSLNHKKTVNQCYNHWAYVINPLIIKGPWSDEEDNKLREAVRTYGVGSWAKIAKNLIQEDGSYRTTKQCTQRWTCFLDPMIIHDPWTEEELQRLIEAVRMHGCGKWTKIAKNLIQEDGKYRTAQQCRLVYITKYQSSSRKRKKSPTGSNDPTNEPPLKKHNTQTPGPLA